ncbi:MAG: cation diffusion facilitator family transporter [Planctomycetota bacterium]|jgi:cation diffusion facilitator family transporter
MTDSRADISAAKLSPRAVTRLGLVVNVVLSAAKMAAGWVCASQAIFADGLHSLSDCVTDLAVLAGIRISNRPADESHPYGHRRAMTLVTAVLGLLLLVAAMFVGAQAILTFAEKHARGIRPALPLALAVASVAIKEALYHLTVRVGRRAGDISVVANAWHHRSDAFSSVAAAAGLTAVAVGGPKWQFMDHATAMVLASFLIVMAVRILRGVVEELMDRAPDPAVMTEIRQAVAATKDVRDFHAIRARRLGAKVEMDVHVLVDPNLTVAEGHDIATSVHDAVVDCCPFVLNVVVHIEPAED